jgi:hypothetical protein
LLLTIDVFSSFLGAAVYTYLTSSTGLLQSAILSVNLSPKWHPQLASFLDRAFHLLQIRAAPGWTEGQGPLLSRDEAKVLCSILLFSLGVSARLNRGIWSVFFPSDVTVKEETKVVIIKKEGVRKKSKEGDDVLKSPPKEKKANGVRKRKSTTTL